MWIVRDWTDRQDMGLAWDMGGRRTSEAQNPWQTKLAKTRLAPVQTHIIT